MAKTQGKSSGARRPKGATPPPARTASAPRTASYPDKLTLNDLNDTGPTDLLLAGPVRTWYDRDGRQLTGAAIIIDVHPFGDKAVTRSHFLSIGRPDHVAVKKQLGEDMTAWGGKTIQVAPDDSKRYINVVDDTPF